MISSETASLNQLPGNHSKNLFNLSSCHRDFLLLSAKSFFLRLHREEITYMLRTTTEWKEDKAAACERMMCTRGAVREKC
ncbi:CLUMA_CG012414, isoform A [Clunio marinus]|uniref:CLUMA_CG012414, isoform A n=1 Tax=Clunio marinus TaxID=568069 RepID=A0A1J1IH30_9DIPT|nr:CLUMA_CG012414, isoform A [Clunio marinus]